MNKKLRAMLALIMGVVTATSFVACGNKDKDKPYEIEKRARTGWTDTKEYTFNDYTSQMPDVWNTILTSDATNVDLASYMGSWLQYLLI